MRLVKGLLFAMTLLSMPVMAADSPYTKPDDTWVALSGTAIETTPTAFLLDYGKGLITVEMDDWSWYEKDGYGLIEGDKVTVYGEVDDDFAEAAKIEASSVYVENTGTVFYADSADEEEFRYTITTPIVVGYTELVGTVSSVGDNEFTVDTGKQKLTVDTSSMSYNPLDKKGFQQIDKGDLVSITGDMEDDLLESRELMADSIITLEEDNA